MTDPLDILLFQEKIKETENLQERIRLCTILAHKNGHSIKTIASILRISENSVCDYITNYEQEKK
jgi:transposase